MTINQKLNVSLGMASAIVISILLVLIITAYKTGKAQGVHDGRVQEQLRVRELGDSIDSVATQNAIYHVQGMKQAIEAIK